MMIDSSVIFASLQAIAELHVSDAHRKESNRHSHPNHVLHEKFSSASTLFRRMQILELISVKHLVPRWSAGGFHDYNPQPGWRLPQFPPESKQKIDEKSAASTGYRE